jgi:Tfp pilus assembly protein PilN
LNSTIPDNVVFETLIVKADTINFSGVALSQTALNILINNMQLDNHFYDVRISRIESQNELSNAVMFDITSNISLEGGV